MKILCGILAGLMIHGGIYLRPAVVREAHDNNTVIAETHDGNLWEFYADSLDTGAEIVLIMDDCGTEDITDDKIMGVY